MAEPGQETVQDIVGKWWDTVDPAVLAPGRLVRTFVPYPDVHTYGLVLEGREGDRDHTTARFKLEPIRQGDPPRPSRLPVAALPTNTNERYIVQRGKRRPALVLSLGGPEIPRAVLQGGAGYQRRSCVLVAPYYGADQDGTRGGFPTAFLDRVRRVEYPHYVLDTLPTGGAAQSVLRLDHVLAVGCAPENFDITRYQLTAQALAVIHDWFRWLIEGVLPDEGLLALVRSELLKIQAAT